MAVSIQELDADPHGVFRRYRAEVPFIEHETGALIALRFEDIESLAKNPKMRATETAYPKMMGIPPGSLFDLFKHGMLTANGTTHRKRRSPFTGALASRLIQGLRLSVRETAEDLIKSWQNEREIDLVDRYTSLIPALTISRLLGLPQDDVPHFTRLSYQVSRVVSYTFKPEDIPDLEHAAQELQNYVSDLIEERRRQPGDDFLSRYVAEADDALDLSPIETVVQIIQLIIGGTDTTRVAGAMQVALLLQNREQWTAVCNNLDLVPAAVAEALRYEPSAASFARCSIEDIEISGRSIPAGQFIILSTMSAMRDERVYANPDVFDIYRTDSPRVHPVFGSGLHRCIGEGLAKLELEESLRALCRLAPQIRLAGPVPSLVGHSGIRRIGKMPVRVAED